MIVSWVECDFCGSQAEYPSVVSYETAKEMRRGAATAGWHSRGAVDICDACWESGERFRRRGGGGR